MPKAFSNIADVGRWNGEEETHRLFPFVVDRSSELGGLGNRAQTRKAGVAYDVDPEIEPSGGGVRD